MLHKHVGAGLRNLGNTCFMNSVLQALLHSPDILTAVESSEHQRDCTLDKTCLVCAMESLVRETKSAQQAISPHAMHRYLPRLSPAFGYGAQQDAHEYLRLFIDSLQKQSTTNNEALEQSYWFRLFHGVIESGVRCCRCNHVSKTLDPIEDIPVEVNAGSVINGLKRFVTVEFIGEESGYKCEACKQVAPIKKTLRLLRIPKVLTLHLKRFTFNSYGMKLTNFVPYPKTLSITEYLTAFQRNKKVHGTADLFAVIVHHGQSLQGGHYTAYVCVNRQWYHFDDSSVYKVSEQAAMSQHAYMLMYTTHINDPLGWHSSKMTLETLRQKRTQTPLDAHQKSVNGKHPKISDNGSHHSLAHSHHDKNGSDSNGFHSSSSSQTFIGPSLPPGYRKPICNGNGNDSNGVTTTPETSESSLGEPAEPELTGVHTEHRETSSGKRSSPEVTSMCTTNGDGHSSPKRHKSVSPPRVSTVCTTDTVSDQNHSVSAIEAYVLANTTLEDVRMFVDVLQEHRQVQQLIGQIQMTPEQAQSFGLLSGNEHEEADDDGLTSSETRAIVRYLTSSNIGIWGSTFLSRATARFSGS